MDEPVSPTTSAPATPVTDTPVADQPTQQPADPSETPPPAVVPPAPTPEPVGEASSMTPDMTPVPPAMPDLGPVPGSESALPQTPAAQEIPATNETMSQPPVQTEGEKSILQGIVDKISAIFGKKSA